MRYSTILVLGFLAAAAGCDLFNNALEVQNPSNIPASGLETPGNAQLLVNGAVADFECAAGAYVVMGGLITDELRDATQTADRFPYDRRTMASSDRRYAVNTCIGLGVYTPLLGQEGAQVGAGYALETNDWVFPSYREMAIAMMRKVDPIEILHMFRGTWHGGLWDPRWRKAPTRGRWPTPPSTSCWRDGRRRRCGCTAGSRSAPFHCRTDVSVIMPMETPSMRSSPAMVTMCN